MTKINKYDFSFHLPPYFNEFYLHNQYITSLIIYTLTYTNERIYYIIQYNKWEYLQHTTRIKNFVECADISNPVCKEGTKLLRTISLKVLLFCSYALLPV